MIEELKYFKRLLCRQEPFIFDRIEAEVKWYGKPNLGFFVGHYPQNFDSNSVIYSAGVGEDISFELDLLEKQEHKIYLFDPTPKSKMFFKKYELNNSLFFNDWGFNRESGTTHFYLPQNDAFVSGSVFNNSHLNSAPITVEMKTLEDSMAALGHKSIDLLKLDIEGSEYAIIDEIVSKRLVVNQIAVEFHHFMTAFSVYQTKNAIKKLQNAGYRIIGYSANRHEITFMK